MLLPVYRGAHVHGIGLPNTREWVSTRLACVASWDALPDIPPGGPPDDDAVVCFWTCPLAGHRPSMHNGLWP